jgi:general secretion pathway protein D
MDSKPSTPPSTRNDPPEEMVTVNFEQVDVRMVLKSIGEITGTNFIPHPSVSGPITVMSPTRIRRSEVYGFLQSVLDVYGYATIEMDNGVVKVVPKTDAIKRNLAVHIGADPAEIQKTDELITQIIPLKYADPAEVSQIIEPLLSAGTQNAACPRINSILIIDTSSNIHYIAQIIQLLDVEGSEEKFVTIPLKYASAQVLSDQINRILEKTPGTTGAPAGNARARITSTTGKNLKVLPDERTNALIVVAGDQDLETIRGLVARLDVERPTGMDSVHVKFLNHADANEVARSLESAVAGMKMVGAVDSKQAIQITPHPSTNALIVVASPQDFEVIEQIAEKLDVVREQVLVEMLILEVTEEALKQIGVDWATMDQAVSNSTRGFGLTNLGPRASYTGGTLEGLALGLWKGSGSDVQIGAILQALQTTTGVNILSTSSVVTSNHHPANMVAGENRPFVTASRITETTDPTTPTVIKQYDYKDVGVTMKIIPHVSQGGLITLDIDGEITKLLESATSASDTPVTAKRHVQTNATMKGDATVVIGGLTRDDTTRVEKKVPLLGDLPLIGLLFRSREEQVQKTNLLIFITPHVMAGQEDWVEVSSKKREEMPPAHEWNP